MHKHMNNQISMDKIFLTKQVSVFMNIIDRENYVF